MKKVFLFFLTCFIMISFTDATYYSGEFVYDSNWWNYKEIIIEPNRTVSDYPVSFFVTFPTNRVDNCTDELRIGDETTEYKVGILKENYFGGFCQNATIQTEVNLTDGVNKSIFIFYNNNNATYAGDTNFSVYLLNRLSYIDEQITTSSNQLGYSVFISDIHLMDEDNDSNIEVLAHQGIVDSDNIHNYLDTYNSILSCSPFSCANERIDLGNTSIDPLGGTNGILGEGGFIYDFGLDGNNEYVTVSIVYNSNLTYQVVNLTSNTILYERNLELSSGKERANILPCDYENDGDMQICSLESYNENASYDMLRIMESNLTDVANITLDKYSADSGKSFFGLANSNGDGADEIYIMFTEYENSTVINIYKYSLVDLSLISNTTYSLTPEKEIYPNGFASVDYLYNGNGYEEILISIAVYNKTYEKWTTEISVFDDDLNYISTPLEFNYTIVSSTYYDDLIYNGLTSYDIDDDNAKEVFYVTSDGTLPVINIYDNKLNKNYNSTQFGISGTPILTLKRLNFYDEDIDSDGWNDFAVGLGDNTGLTGLTSISIFTEQENNYYISGENINQPWFAWDNFQVNNTTPNLDDTIKFQAYWWSGNKNLSHYVFSYRLWDTTYDRWTTDWINETPVAFASTNNTWSNVTMLLNDYLWDGKDVYWKFYANTTDGNITDTSLQVTKILEMNTSLIDVNLLDKMFSYHTLTVYDRKIRPDNDPSRDHVLFYFNVTSRFNLSIGYVYTNITTWTRQGDTSGDYINNVTESRARDEETWYEGYYKFNIEAVNYWNASKFASTNKTFWIDLNAPIWTLLGPTNNTNQSTNFSIQMRLNDILPETVLYSYDNYITNYSLANYSGTHDYNVTVDITNLTAGNHEIYFFAEDHFNDQTTEVFYFSIPESSGGGGGGGEEIPEEPIITPPIIGPEYQDEADIVIVISDGIINIFPKTLVVYAGQGEEFIVRSLGKQHTFLIKNGDNTTISLCASASGEITDWTKILTPEGETVCQTIGPYNSSWFDVDISVPITAEPKDYPLYVDFFFENNPKETTSLIVLKITPSSGLYGILYFIFKKLYFTLFFTPAIDFISFQKGVGMLIPALETLEIPYFGLITWLFLLTVFYIGFSKLLPKEVNRNRNKFAILSILLGFILVMVIY